MVKQRRNRGKKVSRERNPYAHIDWTKAKEIFHHPSSPGLKQGVYPAVRTILAILAKAGEKGLIFMAYGDKPGIEHVLTGNVSFERWRLNHVVKRLAREHFVALRYNDDGSTTAVITKYGQIRALTYQLDAMKLAKPRFWDGKWRLVIYDVPEKHKKLRDLFHQRLLQLGLHQLQESVYVSPYHCFDEVEFLRELYGVAFTVRYLLVEKIEDDVFLRSHFNLII